MKAKNSLDPMHMMNKFVGVKRKLEGGYDYSKSKASAVRNLPPPLSTKFMPPKGYVKEERRDKRKRKRESSPSESSESSSDSSSSSNSSSVCSSSSIHICV